MTTRPCERCGTPIAPIRAAHRFCSLKCRRAYISVRGPMAVWRGAVRISEKRCCRCDTTKPIEEFSPKEYTTAAGRLSVRFRSWCKACERGRLQRLYERDQDKIRARAKAWRYGHPTADRLNQRVKSLRINYGLTLEEYDRLYDAQHGRCVICDVEKPRLKLGVDHCHTTGRVRGLLCHRCNLALGYVREDERVVFGLLAYLHSHCRTEHAA